MRDFSFSKWVSTLLLLAFFIQPGSGLIATVNASEKIAVKPVEPFYKPISSDEPTVYEPQITYLSPEKQAPIAFTSLGATWKQDVPAGTSVELEVRLKNDGKYTDWYEMDADPDGKGQETDPSFAESFLATNRGDGYQYRVSLHSSVPTATPVLEDLKFTFVRGGTPADRTNLLASSQKTAHYQESEFLPDDFDADTYLQNSTATSLVKSTALTAQAESPVIFPPQVKSKVKTPVKTTATPKKTSPAKSASQLKIISRAEWGADESLRLFSVSGSTDAKVISFEDDYYTKYAEELKESKHIGTDENGNQLTWPLSYPENITKIIVHHTASTKNLDDPMRAIRDIYVYHTMSNGWGDIGYNYIIDQQGNIYEGRYGGEMVVGAHAGAGNFGSIGISVLGNFSDEEPPEAVVTALTALIKEKAEQYNIDTEGATIFRGESYPNVMGHRDIMATACPGEKMYALLPLIKKLAKVETTTVVKGTGTSAHDFSWPQNAAPAITLEPKSKKTVTLTIKNTGTKAWPAESYFKIMPDQNSKTFLKNYAEIFTGTVGKEVSPGDTASVKVLLVSNATSGNALLSLQPVIGGTFISKTLKFGLQVKSPPAKLKYNYELASIIYSKSQFKKGDTVTVTVKLRNTGTSPWQKSGNNKVTLGADIPKDHLNTLLSTPSNRLASLQEDLVQSGQLGTFIFNIKIPKEDGIYKESFTPVVEGIQWMQNRNSYLQVQVGNATEVVTTTPTIVQDKNQSGVVSNPTTTPTSVTPATATPTGASTINIATKKLDTLARPRSIRVDLSYRGNPAVISASGPFAIYEGKRKIVDLAANDQVNVKYENSTFTVTAKLQNYQIAGRPRFVPASDATIMRIDNWERRNTWGDKANNNEFRGVLEALIYEKELHIVNELSLENYLKGIAEEASTAPDEKIKTIMVIARTYARFYMDIAKKFPGAPFDLNDDPNYSQKYLGYSFEKRSPKTARLAAETAGKYVTYQGKLIKTPYFSKSDGKKTISAKEKWGWTDTPFLQSVDDTLCKSTTFSGHGVGLSGCGATAMAEQGKTYQEIITYYYQGTAITQALY